MCAPGHALHADDTPVPVLDPGRGKTKTGRLWTAVRDERPLGSTAPPAAFYLYSPDRKAEHARALLGGCRGFLHADGYAGFAGLYQRRPGDRRRRAADRGRLLGACAAQDLRRACRHTDRPPRGGAGMHRANCSPIEADIRGQQPAERSRRAAQRSAPMLAELKAFLDATLAKISGKSRSRRRHPLRDIALEGAHPLTSTTAAWK